MSGVQVYESGLGASLHQGASVEDVVVRPSAEAQPVESGVEADLAAVVC